MDELGLFPLGLVLLPTEKLPLHLRGPVKELIGECIEHETEFGLVYADDQGIRDVGTRARVPGPHALRGRPAERPRRGW
jgi:Lon protease-like protein